MKLYEIISEQDFAGYTKEKTGSILSLARLDLEKTKKYFTSLFNKVSVMSLSSLGDNINDEIERAQKNMAAIGHKSDTYFDALDSFSETNQSLSELDDIATELDDYRTLVSDLVDVMDNLRYGARRLDQYLKSSDEIAPIPE